MEFTSAADPCQPIQGKALPWCSRRDINLSRHAINLSQYHQQVGFVAAILADIPEFGTLSFILSAVHPLGFVNEGWNSSYSAQDWGAVVPETF